MVHLVPHTPPRHSCVVQPTMGGVFGNRPGHRPDGHARECHVECCIEHEHIPREKEESNGRIRHDTDPVVRWMRGDELDESTRQVVMGRSTAVQLNVPPPSAAIGLILVRIVCVRDGARRGYERSCCRQGSQYPGQTRRALRPSVALQTMVLDSNSRARRCERRDLPDQLTTEAASPGASERDAS